MILSIKTPSKIILENIIIDCIFYVRYESFIQTQIHYLPALENKYTF